MKKKIVRQITIKRQTSEGEDRYVVQMDIKMGGLVLKEQFSLSNRDKFDYPVLIGRNVLTGRAIVDTALSDTLY